ncbi:uncharacterized protein MELLADRAFT_102793 [Melampsora larici-populina 98AG31]|uniref:Uncharacterized protein n=1 Tax=Melampsora larici-populina (strain 98AG31 / pathotype 3-4-7) TaxID=747676 RepID=F4R9E1_MELLP|nr:uncharacterized protein MELLADRAFT_102793 [Melampsora larici-populina 98AG31]EGG11171.1 hypothetical protein MELLADRAFT_102793 [Melampsora larici-populina 98AG31]
MSKVKIRLSTTDRGNLRPPLGLPNRNVVNAEVFLDAKCPPGTTLLRKCLKTEMGVVGKFRWSPIVSTYTAGGMAEAGLSGRCAKPNIEGATRNSRSKLGIYQSQSSE